MRPAFALPTTLMLLVAAFPVPSAHSAHPFTVYHEGFNPPGIGSGGFGQQEAWYGRAADLDGDGRDELITGRNQLGTNRAILQVRRFGAGLWDPTSTSSFDVGAGTTPGLCEVADLDGDGLLDLAVPVFDTLAVLPGTSLGNFGSLVAIRMPGIGGLAIADFDLDGVRDLAVTRYLSDEIQIWRGTGSLGFSLLGAYATHNWPLEIAAVDLNGDGAPDLVAAVDTVSIALVGDGIGGFTPFDIAANRAEAAGDLNGDGNEDVLSSTGALLGNGDGTFQASLSFPALQFCKAADLDEDGQLDLVGKRVLSPLSMVSVQHGLGDGQFGPPSHPAWWASQPRMFAIGDFDGDGHLDLALPGRNVDPDAIFFGRGNGAFFAPHQVGLTSPALHVASGHMGGDSRPDLLVTSRAANSMSVLLSNGLGSWTPPDTLILPGTPSGRRLALADLNGDSRDDIVVGYSNLAAISVWLTQPSGLPGARTDLVVPWASTADLQVADLDHDQVPDILWLAPSTVSAGSPIHWFRGLGGGTFAAVQALPVNAIKCFVVGDLSGDGVQDIAFPGSNVNAPAIRVTIASSPGVFPPPTSYDWLSVDPPLPNLQIVIGDFNGDLHADLALQSERGVVRLHGLGGGSFASPTGIGVDASGGFSTFCEARDLDANGVDDLLSGFQQPGRLKMLRFGPGGGLISASVLGVSPGATSASLTVTDVDDNGTPDIVSGARQPQLDVLLNRTPPEVLGVRPPRATHGGLTLAPLASPARGPLVFRIGTTSSTSIRMELLDLQGRSVRTAIVRPNPGAATSVTLGESASLASGVYFARARQDGRTATTRVSVLH